MQKYLLMVALGIGCSGHQAQPTVLVMSPLLSIEQARFAALSVVPGQVAQEELDDEDGRWVYEFEIQPAIVGVPTHEVAVDAVTGAILEVEADDDNEADDDDDDDEADD